MSEQLRQKLIKEASQNVPKKAGSIENYILVKIVKEVKARVRRLGLTTVLAEGDVTIADGYVNKDPNSPGTPGVRLVYSPAMKNIMFVRENYLEPVKATTKPDKDTTMKKTIKVWGGVVVDGKEYLNDAIIKLIDKDIRNWKYAGDIGKDGDIVVIVNGVKKVFSGRVALGKALDHIKKSMGGSSPVTDKDVKTKPFRDNLDILEDNAAKTNSRLGKLVAELKKAGIPVLEVEEGDMDVDAAISIAKKGDLELSLQVGHNYITLGEYSGEGDDYGVRELSTKRSIKDLVPLIKKELPKYGKGKAAPAKEKTAKPAGTSSLLNAKAIVKMGEKGAPLEKVDHEVLMTLYKMYGLDEHPKFEHLYGKKSLSSGERKALIAFFKASGLSKVVSGEGGRYVTFVENEKAKPIAPKSATKKPAAKTEKAPAKKPAVSEKRAAANAAKMKAIKAGMTKLKQQKGVQNYIKLVKALQRLQG